MKQDKYNSSEDERKASFLRLLDELGPNGKDLLTEDEIKQIKDSGELYIGDNKTDLKPQVTISTLNSKTFRWTVASGFKVIGYAITETNEVPTTWNKKGDLTKGQKSIDDTSAKTYYVWVQDETGKISSEKISTDKVSIIKTAGTSIEVKEGEITLATDTCDKYILEGAKLTITASANTGYRDVAITVNDESFTSGEKYEVKGNTTIKTIVTENTYAIAFNANGGAGEMARMEGIKYTENKQLIENTFTRTGYTFKGWADTQAKANAGTVDYEDKTVVSKLNATNGATVTMYAVWEINQYTVTCEDYFVDAENNLKVPLGSAGDAKAYDYNSTVSGADWGSDTTKGKYHTQYKYVGASSDKVPANNNLKVYRYFHAWTNINIYYADRTTEQGATVSFSNDGTTWKDIKNEAADDVTKPWGTTYYIKNIRPVNATEEFDSVSNNLTWDATNGYYKYTPTEANTSMNIYMKYKVYTITLNNQSATTAGTDKIYLKYNTGYYKEAACTNAITSSAAITTVPARTGYTFGGYYKETAATNQILTNEGKLSGNTTAFTSDATIYAKWTKAASALDITLSAENFVYNAAAQKPTVTVKDGSTTLTQGSGKDVTVSFTSDTTNVGDKTATIAGNSVYNSTTKAFYTGNTTKAYHINNASITFNVASNSGTISGTSPLYVKKGSTGIYTGIRNTTAGTIPTATKTGHDFTGWWTSATGGTKIINADKSVVASVSGWTDSNKNWQITSNQTLYAQFSAKTFTVSFNGNGGSGGQTGTNATATYGQAMPAISTTAPTRTGYEFMGWYDKADYTQGTKYYNADGTSAKTFDKFTPLKLYAGWKLSQCWVVDVEYSYSSRGIKNVQEALDDLYNLLK